MKLIRRIAHIEEVRNEMSVVGRKRKQKIFYVEKIIT